MTTDDKGRALYQEEDVLAAHMAAELLHHFEELKALNWEPQSNAKEISDHRAEIRTLLDALNGSLILSGSLRPIQPAESVTYDAARKGD